MQLDHNPFFRKPITSWYDSNFACWTVMVLMGFVFIFAVAGIIVGSTTNEFHEYVWLPIFLSVSSLFLVLKIALRIRQRSKND
jgi:cytochrome c biogenesis protein CcdA